jgi:adenylosuccinate synthase
MTEKIYHITDLGPGDGGKGGVVHKIATMMCAHTIIKVGGAQGSHGVRTSSGERYAFSQWGCGTFEGIKTHISPRLIVSPVGLINEAEALKYEHGIHNAFNLLTVDQRALCATPYHGIASRLKEMARRDNPRGTIGTGVGEAYRYAQQYPDLTILAKDLSRPDLKNRLAAVRDQVRRNLEPIVNGDFLPDDRDEVQNEIELLGDDKFLDHITGIFQEAGLKAKIVDPEYLAREILSQDGVAVVESSHGVLTDNLHGFHPHTSAIRTLPCFTHAMLREAGYRGHIVNIGVHRAYEIRHGAGPMPTADPAMAENLLPGSNKEENRYQGKVRVGPLDLVLMRYAIDVCGGPKAFDGLAITWFDQIKKNGRWQFCDHYATGWSPDLFTGEGKIRVKRFKVDDARKLYQAYLGIRLNTCQPELTTINVPPTAERDELFSFCAGILEEKLSVPIRLVSLGPTERDKICK